MTKLSVNINKIATLRNARGGNVPDVLKAAIDCERFGAQGITVHPRPDERHIRYADVRALKPLLTTEFNIEGNPIQSFCDLVCEVHPAQVTLVPDAENVLTSNAGWDTKRNLAFLQKTCAMFKREGIRVSIFIDPDVEMIRYAAGYAADRERAIAPYYAAACEAVRLGLGLNAGHDLNTENLRYFHETIPGLLEVSIGHALISDALYWGLERTIQAYLAELK